MICIFKASLHKYKSCLFIEFIFKINSFSIIIIKNMRLYLKFCLQSKKQDIIDNVEGVEFGGNYYVVSIYS